MCIFGHCTCFTCFQVSMDSFAQKARIATLSSLLLQQISATDLPWCCDGACNLSHLDAIHLQGFVLNSSVGLISHTPSNSAPPCNHESSTPCKHIATMQSRNRPPFKQRTRILPNDSPLTRSHLHRFVRSLAACSPLMMRKVMIPFMEPAGHQKA